MQVDAGGEREQLAEGRQALVEGRWGAAADCFERVLAVRESAGAYEGLSWAAWWRDDAEAMFGARERAFQMYRRAGDAAGAARMATWLAVDELDFHGAVAVARGWLGRARRLLDRVDVCADHGWLAFMEGFLAQQRGDTATALDRAQHATELGRRLDVADLEMLGLALEGAVRVSCAEVAEGMDCLDEATATALDGEAEVPISAAWACCFLVTSCTAVQDYTRAAAWCERIAEFAERYGSRYMLAFCRAEYGAVYLWRGQWEAAESVLQASVADFSRSRPAWVLGPQLGLAELRRRQGRVQEAIHLLDGIGALPGALLCRAELALDRGEALRAVELSERVLRQVPDHVLLERAPALDVLVRASIARGRYEEAAVALTLLRQIQARLGTPALQARAELAEGMLLAGQGEHARARGFLEDAVDGFDRNGDTFDAARARVELATVLVALGRVDLARSEATLASDTLRHLGAATQAHAAEQIRHLAVGNGESESAVGGGDTTAAPSVPTQPTPREREVLDLLAQGLTNRQIAERLVVSEHTVHRHVTNILRKLDVPSRSAAAAHAVRAGLGGQQQH